MDAVLEDLRDAAHARRDAADRVGGRTRRRVASARRAVKVDPVIALRAE